MPGSTRPTPPPSTQEALVSGSEDCTAPSSERAQAQNQERLRALGETAAGVAHDLNNILQTIQGRIKLAKQKIQEGGNALDDLSVVEVASQSAASIVQRITEFLRPRASLSWSVVHLPTLLDETASLAKTRLPEGVTLSCETAPTSPLQGRPDELREAFFNIVINAIEAVGEHGHVVLRCGTANDLPFVEVQDTGPGIPDGIRKKLFEPFVSTKQHGTGLGLSIARWLLRRHQARIEIKDNVETGTCFHIVFKGPQISPEHSHDTSEEAATLPPLNSTADRKTHFADWRILIVDDDLTIGEMLHDTFSAYGHRVTLASDANQALSALEAQPFDLMLTDLDLPGTKGWELARIVRNTHPHLIIGLITGWALDTTPEEMQTRGADFVLEKPFAWKALVAALNRLGLIL